MPDDERPIERVFQPIECQACGLVYTGEFTDEPTPPLNRQHCRRCQEDTSHKIVEIEVVSRA